MQLFGFAVHPKAQNIWELLFALGYNADTAVFILISEEAVGRSLAAAHNFRYPLRVESSLSAPIAGVCFCRLEAITEENFSSLNNTLPYHVWHNALASAM